MGFTCSTSSARGGPNEKLGREEDGEGRTSRRAVLMSWKEERRADDAWLCASRYIACRSPIYVPTNPQYLFFSALTGIFRSSSLSSQNSIRPQVTSHKLLDSSFPIATLHLLCPHPQIRRSSSLITDIYIICLARTVEIAPKATLTACSLAVVFKLGSILSSDRRLF